MTIELWDMDVEYKVETDVNTYGKDFVRISVPDNGGICLDKTQCLELARVLTFLSNEIKEE